MDVVKAFNSELSSLYEVKPPISKAKMTGITKSAIKGIKFYKHIVQSVEKFIQKCRPEYKVPGLYVVDSIVRQSRHQFGADKDVFGPRFTKNITSTFQHLFKCAEEDRSRIIRVLNLWQKNSVFPSDVIQPLLDMGHPNTSSESGPTNDESSTQWKGWSQGNEKPTPENRTYAEMSTKNLEKFTKAEMTNAIEEEASRSSMFKAHVKSEKISDENAVKFDANLLYFDYGDEEDEEEAKNECSQMSYDISDPHKTLAVSMAQKFLCDPDILRQLSSFSSEQAQQAIKTEVKAETEDPSYQSGARRSPTQPPLPPTAYQQPSLPMGIPPEADKDERMLPQPPLPAKDLDERSLAAIMTPQRILPPISLASLHSAGVPPIQADKDDRMLPDPKAPPRDLDERSLAAILAPLDRGLLSQMPFPDASSGVQFPGGILPPQPPMGDPMRQDGDERVMFSMPGEPPLPPQDFDERTLVMPVEERSRKERSRSRSNSRNRSSRSSRRRSRSRSPRRKRSRSPRNKNRSRSKERERLREKEREKEKERERKRKGIPPIKKDCVSICSTTIWIGHVPKSCTGADISNVFGEFGTVTSVDTIPPRGCAFIVMDRRQDGYRALKNLKNLKLSGSSVKMAWAPGKGVKGKEYKDYWEVDLGVSYIPFKKIPERAEALDNLEEGGWIDEESLSEKLKMIRKQPDKAFNPLGMIPDPTAVSFNAVQPPTMVPPPIMTPTSVNLPMLLHHPMQPQFGLHLPGLIPPQAMVMQVPMGIPPPNPMLMVQQQSQSLLGGQALPLVGGVPSLVPRSVPLGNALQGLKNVPLGEQAVGSPMVPAPNTGDATPTEEDGTNVSSPSAQKSAQASVQTSGISSQASQAVAQFTAMMAANRSMMSSLPPVSTSGTPIPFPPPNSGFNFPPPGMRPGQMGPNSQFPFMSKPEDGRGGMAPHMMNARLPFQEQHSGKEPPNMNNRDPDRQSNDMDISRQGSSPMHPGKMQQEMVISTDDESSMDRDYSRIEVQSGPRFTSGNDFARMPMNMHRMRGPMGPMQGSRFPPMGSPFNSGMGGPRGPGMHPGMRMEMDFPGNSGPRMQMGPHGGRRGPDCEERDWYPRDYDGPPFERDRRYNDERGRDPWDGPNMDSRHAMRNHENDMRDDQPVSSNRENRVDDHRDRDHAPRKPARKSNSGKDLMADFHRLRHYQGDKKPLPHHSQDKSKDRAKADEDKNKISSNDKRPDPPPKNNSDELNARKDREARKRSRWGRTLSEEREIQQKKRTEIEMKFQSYEQSAQAAGTLIPDSSDNPDVPLDGDIPAVESGNSVEPMDTGDTGITPPAPVPILSAEAVNELISHPAITKLVSETVAPITSETSICGSQLNESVPEFTNDIPVSTSSSEAAPEMLSSSNHVDADLPPSSTPEKLTYSNVDTDMFRQESNEIKEHSVSEPSKEHQTSFDDNRVLSNSTLSSTIDITVPETANKISEINENSCDNTAKDVADISSVNKSPLVSTES